MSKKAVQVRCGVYARISEDRYKGVVREVGGIELHKGEGKKIADRQGWPVTGYYVDNDVSAKVGKLRPEWERLLADLAAGRINAVAVVSQERLFRWMKDHARFMEVARSAPERVEVRFRDGSQLDMQTIGGHVTSGVLTVLSEAEVMRLSARLRMLNLARARAGLPTGGGRRPYGFQGDYISHEPSEVKVIREMAKRVLNDEPLNSIVNRLNERGVPTVSGAKWSSAVVRQILTKPRIVGVIEYTDEDGERRQSKAVWKPVLAAAVYADVHARLHDAVRTAKFRNTRIRNKRRYLLTGLAECTCGAKMQYGRGSGKYAGSSAYVCRPDLGCGRYSVAMPRLDELVTTTVRDRLANDPDIRARMVAPANPAVVKELDALTTAVTQVGERMSARGADVVALAAERDDLYAELDELRERADAAFHEIEFDVDAVVKGWDGLAVQEQRDVLDRVVARLVVHPAVRRGPGFDPKRVELVIV